MKVLFVCKGNICRSPAGQYLLKKMLNEANIHTIKVESAGLLKRTHGKKIHPKISRYLKWFGCDASKYHATFIGRKKLDEYDYILAMDQDIFYELNVQYASDVTEKIYLFTSISDKEILLDIEDPIYTGKFLFTIRRINRLCKLWLFRLKEEL
ncbi:protein-tyrosine phosphatase [Enterococcus sp. DIV2402]|uniref:protein-tyrosine-phosphatase n=1 Tax=Candidatus Enterococcus lowellii TaxID=2230877 RepID=A0ABZ2SNS9_9ENTE|nr:hypothetical protein [Enterococcus sp. DIV2402]MBO0463792.1 hypothetical protein [Enterococcus sp. DIV2402]